jgi:pimeloyl-ACP methyl ester carboxylesterase
MLPDLKNAAGVAYRESGRQDSPALVLLHGIGSTSAAWRLQYAPLGERCRVIAWDAPGYGGSTPLPAQAPATADYAGALARLLDALGVEQAVVGTNSWGTPSGVAFARLYPQRVRALLLGGPTAGWGWLPQAEQERRTAVRIERITKLGMTAMRAEDAPQLVAPGTRREVLDWIRSPEGVTLEGYAQALRNMAAADVAQEAAGVRCPVRILCGVLDQRTPPEQHAKRIAAALPNGTLQMIANCGHLPHLEYPEVFNAAALEMLQAAQQPA